MDDAGSLLKQIFELKRNMESKNRDYYTGYMSALSTVEGLLACIPGIGENDAECFIGMWSDYDRSELVTYSGLKRRVSEQEELDKIAAHDPVYSQIYNPPRFSLQDYLDGRKNTNMSRFNYCPWCGKRIDWDKLRKEAKHEAVKSGN